MKAVSGFRGRVAFLTRGLLTIAGPAIVACSVFGSSLDHFTEGGEIACAEGLTRCGEGCYDVESDPNNCGACFNACQSGQVCDQKACASACSGGKTNCSGACVDLQSDPWHCGDCATACTPGSVCGSGTCNLTCPSGQTACAGSCVDTQSDDQHCGACGAACSLGQKCTAGKCAVSCTTGQTLCAGSCVDTETNQNHCGSCDKPCNAGEACTGGQCKIACPGTQTECNGLCFDLLTNDQNCGACGNICKTGEVCGNGTCTLNCPTGQDDCSGSCVDLQTNGAHCGTCGNACGANQECVAGKCAIACKTLLNGTAIDDKAGFFWDGLERAASLYDQARTACAAIGGRLPTASELYRVSATQSATVGQTTHINPLWSLAPYGPSSQMSVRLNNGSATISAKTSSLNYRCVCPPPLPNAYVGANCFGPSGTACAALNMDDKKLAIDTQDRPLLPKSSAIWECAFNRGHLASPARLFQAIGQGVGNGSSANGSNVYVHTSDDIRSDRDLVLRWLDPKTFVANTGLSTGATTDLRPFRCVGPGYDAGTHPATFSDEFVGPLGGLKGEKTDSTAASWAAAASACWGKGGHVASATELAELASQGLTGANAWLWGADESSIVLTSATLQAYRWNAIANPTYASGVDLGSLVKTTTNAFRCVYYPVDATYTGPQSSDCTGGCKALALPGSSGAKVWVDELDRAAASLDAAIAACRTAGGSLPRGRDYVELVRAGLGNGSNAYLWSSDFVYYQPSTLVGPQLAVHAPRWSAIDANFSDAWTTYAGAYPLTTTRPFRCMWTNELR